MDQTITYAGPARPMRHGKPEDDEVHIAGIFDVVSREDGHMVIRSSNMVGTLYVIEDTLDASTEAR